MSTTNLGIIKSEANPLTGTRVQLNTGGWFIAESSAIPKSKVIDSIEVNITQNGQETIRPVGGKEAFKEVVIKTNATPPKLITVSKKTINEVDTPVTLSFYYQTTSDFSDRFIFLNDNTIRCSELTYGETVNFEWHYNESLLITIALTVENQGGAVNITAIYTASGTMNYPIDCFLAIG